jgi:hypothetical protein
MAFQFVIIAFHDRDDGRPPFPGICPGESPLTAVSSGSDAETRISSQLRFLRLGELRSGFFLAHGENRPFQWFWVATGDSKRTWKFRNWRPGSWFDTRAPEFATPVAFADLPAPPELATIEPPPPGDSTAVLCLNETDQISTFITNARHIARLEDLVRAAHWHFVAQFGRFLLDHTAAISVPLPFAAPVVSLLTSTTGLDIMRTF